MHGETVKFNYDFILMPEKCNVTEVYSFSIKVGVVASYRWQRWTDRNLLSSRLLGL
jgi:hypothetical protein